MTSADAHDPIIQGRRCQALWQALVYESIGVDGTVACDDIFLELAGLDPAAVRDRERRRLVRRVDGSLPRTGPDYHERRQQARQQAPAAEDELVLSLLPASVDELAEVLEWPRGRVTRLLKQQRDAGRAVYAYGVRKWMTTEQWKLRAAGPVGGRKST